MISFTTLHFESVGSTNTEAANQAKRGAVEGLCVVADEQTAGRGRQGRDWISEKGSGAYFSIVLRPKFEANRFTLIPLLAGIAVHDALEGFGLKADIKWPNDILVDDNKICGILAETVDTPTGLAVILGIGINLSGRMQNLNATSIESETAAFVERDTVVATVCGYLAEIYPLLDAPHSVIAEWTRRSSFAKDKDVRVDLGDEVFEGTTAGLEESGALRVQLKDSSIRIVQAGDVTRLRPS